MNLMPLLVALPLSVQDPPHRSRWQTVDKALMGGDGNQIMIRHTERGVKNAKAPPKKYGLGGA